MEHSIVEARKMYTQQLCELLAPLLYQGLKSIFDTCKTERKVLKTFQEKLCSIIKWNQVVIDNEFKRIVADSDPAFLDKLIEAVFISNVKVLSVVRVKKSGSINIKVPDTKNFIHKCYIECARYFYRDPTLIDDRESNLSFSEIQRNIKRSDHAIEACVEKTIRDLVPIQEILENYLTEEPEEEEVSRETSPEPAESVFTQTIPEEEPEEVFTQTEEEPQVPETGYASDTEDPFMEDPGAVEPDLFVGGGETINETQRTENSSPIKVVFRENQGVSPTQERQVDDDPFFSSDEEN